VIAVIAGAVFMLFGAIKNGRFLGQMITNRGKLRRRPDSGVPETPPAVSEPPRPTPRA
jgi:hypothetical protein